MYPWANLEVASLLGPLTMVFSLALHAFLCAYLPSSYLVQQEGRGHRKKSSSCMQELIQAEIAETAREAAEKCGRKPHVSRQRVQVLLLLSKEYFLVGETPSHYEEPAYVQKLSGH
jgi:hypothetical protein